MKEWLNDTLVAVKCYGSHYGVVELPARQTSPVHHTVRLGSFDLAEDYIGIQWGDRAIKVQLEDIHEEMERRRVIYAREAALEGLEEGMGVIITKVGHAYYNLVGVITDLDPARGEVSVQIDRAGPLIVISGADVEPYEESEEYADV